MMRGHTLNKGRSIGRYISRSERGPSSGLNNRPHDGLVNGRHYEA